MRRSHTAATLTDKRNWVNSCLARNLITHVAFCISEARVNKSPISNEISVEVKTEIK